MKRHYNKKNNLYKKKYYIVFYASDDDTFVAGFDNPIEICRYKNLEVTETNIQLVRVELYRAIKKQSHRTHMLNGKLMYVYLIDMLDNIENI